MRAGRVRDMELGLGFGFSFFFFILIFVGCQSGNELKKMCIMKIGQSGNILYTYEYITENDTRKKGTPPARNDQFQ